MYFRRSGEYNERSRANQAGYVGRSHQPFVEVAGGRRCVRNVGICPFYRVQIFGTYLHP